MGTINIERILILLYFLMHVHVLMKFELKIGIFAVARPWAIVQGLWSNFMKNCKERILHFNYIF